MIWKLALPTHDEVESEVCVLGDRGATHIMGEAPGQEGKAKLTVYMAFPVLIHVCHESRAFVQNSKISDIHFRHHPTEDNCEVPFRLFRPDIDTLYWDISKRLSKSIPHEEYSIVKKVRFLAVSQKMFHQHMALLTKSILTELSNLEELGVVDQLGPRILLYPSFPVQAPRRAKLRNIEDIIDSGLLLLCALEMWLNVSGTDIDSRREKASWYLNLIGDYWHRLAPVTCKAWNSTTNKFDGLELMIHAFIYYKRGKWTGFPGIETQGLAYERR